MNNNAGILFLLIHVLGDFYFQPKKISQNKNKSFLALLYHSLIYLGATIVIILPFWNKHFTIYALSFSVIHFIIDLLKYIVIRISDKKNNLKEWMERKTGYLYSFDQAIHILALLILSNDFANSGYIINISGWTKELFSNMAIHISKLIKWLLILLLIGKPANVTFLKLFYHCRPVKKEVEDNNNTGATIGILERIIIVVFMSIRQYSAIGLILTAKSIARYNKISEDKEFGEYYLLGTLVSVLYSVVVYLLLFHL